MKLTTISHMIAVAAATGFCMSVEAGEGQSGTLNLNGYVEQFTVTTSNPKPEGGEWNNDNTPPKIVDDSKFAIDCGPATSNEFIYASTTDKVVKCEFRLAVAPVPVPLAPQRDITQAAFCVSTNTTAGGKCDFCAYVNGRWETLSGVEVPSLTSFYDLCMTFDYKNGRFVKFSVKTGESYEDLVSATNNALKWFSTGFGEGTKGISRYCFVGTGDVETFSAHQASIASETASVAGGSVNVPEDIVLSVETSGKTLSEVLAADDQGGNKVIDNIVLGLRDATGLKDNGNLVGSADAASDDPDAIKLGLNAEPLAGTGATVSYQLYGSNVGSFSGEEKPVGESTTDLDGLSIPLKGATIYKYYKVKAAIDYK